MKYICQVDTALFLDAIKNGFEEAGDYEVLSQGEGNIALVYYQTRKAQYIANISYRDIDGQTEVDVEYEQREREEILPISAPQVAARLTFELVKGGVLWGLVYGISYPMGNRSLLLPLIAPACLWAIPLVKWVVKRATAKGKVEDMLTELLGVAPEK